MYIFVHYSRLNFTFKAKKVEIKNTNLVRPKLSYKTSRSTVTFPCHIFTSLQIWDIITPKRPLDVQTSTRAGPGSTPPQSVNLFLLAIIRPSSNYLDSSHVVSCKIFAPFV